MNKKLNIINLIRSIATLVKIAIIFLLLPLPVAFGLTMILLILNNYFDDWLFYYGSIYVNGVILDRHALYSPVNGIVTHIGDDELFGRIDKRDILTKQLEVDGHLPDPTSRNEKYTHITIFLNKFNQHTVFHCGQKIKYIREFTSDHELVPMVKDDELIGSNSGDYLTNTFLYVEFVSGVIMVLTMDKYVSKFVPAKIGAFLGMICRGSQCDLYIPNSYGFIHEVEVNDIVQINQELGVSPFNDLGIVVPKGIGFYSATDLRYNAKSCIESITNRRKLFKDAFRKTLLTLQNPNIGYGLIGALIFNHNQLINTLFLAYSFVFLLGFVGKRLFKYILYSIININGYKEKYTRIYKLMI